MELTVNMYHKLIVLCEYSKFRIEHNSFVSIRLYSNRAQLFEIFEYLPSPISYLFNRMRPIFHRSNHAYQPTNQCYIGPLWPILKLLQHKPQQCNRKLRAFLLFPAHLESSKSVQKRRSYNCLKVRQIFVSLSNNGCDVTMKSASKLRTLIA